MGEILAIVLLIFVLVQVIIGAKKGFLKALLALAAWIFSFAIASYGAKYVEMSMTGDASSANDTSLLTTGITYIMAFIIIVVVCRIIFAIIIHFINKVNDVPGVGFLNHFAGGLLGLMKGIVMVTVILFFISWLPNIGMEDTYHHITGNDPTVEQILDRDNFVQMWNSSVKQSTEQKEQE